MKTIEVVAAIIEHEGRYLATARGYGEFEGQWEFPGGKIEAGENPRDALVREIKEELDVMIETGDFVTTVEYDYPTFHLTMHCFIAHIVEGTLTLLEHEASRWLTPAQLDEPQWLPADVDVVKALKAKLADK